jgi:hypothetical protein
MPTTTSISLRRSAPATAIDLFKNNAARRERASRLCIFVYNLVFYESIGVSGVDGKDAAIKERRIVVSVLVFLFSPIGWIRLFMTVKSR